MTALKNIEITNFRGFCKNSFNFKEKPLVLLTAPNGKGKTSLIDAIEWCLTGDIHRLHQVYNDRNQRTSEKNLQLNERTILKNKDHLGCQTKVILNLTSNNQNYEIIRTQDNDTLSNPGQLHVNGKSGNEAKQILNNLIDGRNFYNYHVCDMQKTYNFLRVGRNDMSEKFAAFTFNHSDAEHVVENLNLYLEDIKKRIEDEQKQQVPESTIIAYRNTLNKYEKSPEILPYDSQQLYPSELTNLQDMTIEKLNDQLRTLYQCGFAHAVALQEELNKSLEAKERKKVLESLCTELLMHKTEIEETVKTGARQLNVRQNAEEKLKKYKNIKLDATNIAGNSKELIKIGSSLFTEQYWKESSDKLKDIKEEIETLNTEIETLTRGDKILDVLSAIVAGKDGLLEYRMEQQHSKPNQPVLCPVCGSERFSTVPDDEIVKQAHNYQAEHKQLIEKNKVKLNNLKGRQRKIVDEQLNNGKYALKEATDAAQKQVDNLTRLYNVSNTYSILLEKLQKADDKEYAQEKMFSVEGIREAIEKNNASILSEDYVVSLNSEINRTLNIVQYSNKNNLVGNAFLEDIRANALGAPEGLVYNENLLRSKISSIRSRIRNFEYLNAFKQLQEAEKKNTESNGRIEELKSLSDKAKNRFTEISKVLKKMKENEYNNVGPYLYSIFCKLSRDVNISKFHLDDGRGFGTLMLMDSNNLPIQNMLSDGQLSVFMLSYFFGNAFQISNSETFKIYFLDDITSTMDDINMLAFFDLIKYQLSNQNSAIDQLFFTTCDSRIQDIFRYKMSQCGLDYKEIGIKEFDNPDEPNN